MEITQRIMFDKDTLGIRIYGKTGWRMQDSIDVGWFVGLAEKDGKVYYFANCVQADGSALADTAFARAFDHGRRDVAYCIPSQLIVD